MGKPVKSTYSPYHPRWYRRRIPIFWWLGKFTYTKFIFRELTSLAVLYAALLLLVQVGALHRGPEAYSRFLELLQSPAVLIVNTVAFAALLFHTTTWLGLAPKAMVIQVGNHRLPNRVVLLAHYAAWIGVSILLIWGLLGR